MILDVNGKKLAFGLSWKPLIDDADPATMAARVARDMNAKTIWHDGRALHMGALAATDRDVPAKDIYAAAAALASMADLGANSLFVYRLQQGASAPIFLMIGVVRGRPRVGFDVVLNEASVVTERAQEFAKVCGSNFVLAGNNEALVDVIGADKVSSTYALSLEQLATAATSTALMRKPRRIVSSKKRKAVVIGVILVLFGAKVGHAKWSEYQELAHRVTPEQRAAEAYKKQLSIQLSAMSLGASAVGPWYQWLRTMPFAVGGWHLSGMDCAASGGTLQCAVLFKPELAQATNESFVGEAPKEWPRPTLSTDGKQISVVFAAPTGGAQRLAERLLNPASVYDANLTFGTQLRDIAAASTNTSVGRFGLFPNGRAVPIGFGITPMQSAKWEVKGPVRNTELIAQFPHNVTLEHLHLDYHGKTTPGLKSSVFMLVASGSVYAKQ
ncbi:putative ATPase (plasmid) [Pararobbsia alpina]|uniref:hypothetical protein n=1 Tax=Pararobbsia alpina TaxID=621374 RepID=UPI0039A7336A